MHRMSRAKQDFFWDQPIHQWIGLQVSRFSAVKDFWGEPTIGSDVKDKDDAENNVRSHNLCQMSK